MKSRIPGFAAEAVAWQGLLPPGSAIAEELFLRLPAPLSAVLACVRGAAEIRVNLPSCARTTTRDAVRQSRWRSVQWQMPTASGSISASKVMLPQWQPRSTLIVANRVETHVIPPDEPLRPVLGHVRPAGEGSPTTGRSAGAGPRRR